MSKGDRVRGPGEHLSVFAGFFGRFEWIDTEWLRKLWSGGECGDGGGGRALSPTLQDTRACVCGRCRQKIATANNNMELHAHDSNDSIGDKVRICSLASLWSSKRTGSKKKKKSEILFYWHLAKGFLSLEPMMTSKFLIDGGREPSRCCFGSPLF